MAAEHLLIKPHCLGATVLNGGDTTGEKQWELCVLLESRWGRQTAHQVRKKNAPHVRRPALHAKREAGEGGEFCVCVNVCTCTHLSVAPVHVCVCSHRVAREGCIEKVTLGRALQEGREGFTRTPGEALQRENSQAAEQGSRGARGLHGRVWEGRGDPTSSIQRSSLQRSRCE